MKRLSTAGPAVRRLQKAQTVGGCQQCGKGKGHHTYVFLVDGLWLCFACAQRRWT